MFCRILLILHFILTISYYFLIFHLFCSISTYLTHKVRSQESWLYLPLSLTLSQFTQYHGCYLVCLSWDCFFLLLISISTPQCRLFSFFSEIIANDVLVCNLISSNSFFTLLLVILWTENFIIIFPCLKFFKRFSLGKKNLPDTVYTFLVLTLTAVPWWFPTQL